MPREAPPPEDTNSDGNTQDPDPRNPQPAVLTSRPATRKRRRGVERTELHGDALNRALDEAIASKPTAALAVLYLIENYQVDLRYISKKLLDKGLDVSFSKVTYREIAPRVNLDPDANLRDIPTFPLMRARIPTWLFKQVCEDIHQSLNLYGPPDEHRTEEARSRFLAPLMNRLVSQFRLLIKNTPETMIEGRLATRGRIEYQFKVCGALTVLFVEVKLEVGSSDERLNAVAQVIAEADACDHENSRINFSGPIYAILCDGKFFDFFTFDASTRPAVLQHGVFRNAAGELTHRVEVHSYEQSTRVSFLRSLRPICETFYPLFLRGYISGLQNYYERSVAAAVAQGGPRTSTPAWASAIGAAEDALRMAVDAAEKAHGATKEEVVVAGEMAESAYARLCESLEATPPAYRRDDCDLMAVWDDSF